MPVTIGGDGSISVPIARAWRAAAPHRLAYRRYAYDPADKYTTASQFTHIAEEKLVDASSSWHVGIRGTAFTPEVLKHTRDLG
jgi:agmatinase